MLRIAVQSKGRLYDETMMLLEEAGIKLNRGKRILLLSAKGFPVEVLFLRDDDIPQSVANGVADIGIVGENEYVEKGQEAKLIKRLGFSKCRLSLAIPKDEEYKGAEWFEGKTIATSYPVILRSFLEERGVKADIGLHRYRGANRERWQCLYGSIYSGKRRRLCFRHESYLADQRLCQGI